MSVVAWFQSVSFWLFSDLKVILPCEMICYKLLLRGGKFLTAVFKLHQFEVKFWTSRSSCDVLLILICILNDLNVKWAEAENTSFGNFLF